jgi:hypothetical protein
MPLCPQFSACYTVVTGISNVRFTIRKVICVHSCFVCRHIHKFLEPELNGKMEYKIIEKVLCQILFLLDYSFN